MDGFDFICSSLGKNNFVVSTPVKDKHVLLLSYGEDRIKVIGLN
jgi:hypothetical protein